MHHSVLYDPRRTATPSQRIEAIKHADRLIRLGSVADVGSPVPVTASPNPPSAPPIPNRMMVEALEQVEKLRMPMGQVETIQRAVLEYYPNITLNDLKANRRTADCVRPRQIAMYMAKTLTGRSLPDIARRFGGRDHTTVLHAVRKIAELRKHDERLSAQLSDIAASLTQEVA